jgi:hypothetical protein
VIHGVIRVFPVMAPFPGAYAARGPRMQPRSFSAAPGTTKTLERRVEMAARALAGVRLPGAIVAKSDYLFRGLNVHTISIIGFNNMRNFQNTIQR